MTLPPYAQTLGLSLVDGDDPTLLAMPFSDALLGRPAFLHGGAIGGFLEMAAYVALHHALAEAGGGRVKQINATISYMRGGRDKTSYARGTVTRLGSRVANVDAAAWQDDAARPIAVARMNYLIVRP